MILHLIPERVDGCAYHRIEIPMHNLEGFEVAQSTVLDGVKDEDLKKISLVVFHGHGCIAESDVQIKRLKSLGLPYVMDVDDWWELDEKHLLHNAYKKDIAKKLIALMQGAAAVTTTTPRLASKIKKHNKNVIVAPNAIDSAQPQWEVKPSNNAELVFGWVGGVHHIEDIKLLTNAFKNIHKHNKINLALGGWSAFNDVFTLFEIWFSGAGTYKKYKRIEARNVYNYGYIYDSLDVCFIPLAANGFNACKSPLKLIEAGFKNKPCIVSRCAPYSDHFTDKEALFVDNEREWYQSIMKLYENPQMLFDYRQALSERVIKDYSIRKSNITREQLYTVLINGK